MANVSLVAIRNRLSLASVPKRDFLLAGVCGLLGFAMSFVHGPRHDLDRPDVPGWLRFYPHVSKVLVNSPWILLPITVCALLLVYSRFRRGGLGVAFVLGALLGRIIGWII
jgi:hypothetical protein